MSDCFVYHSSPDPKQLESLWYSCASRCLDYILEAKRLEEVRVLLSNVGNQTLISKWLSHLEKGEVCVYVRVCAVCVCDIHFKMN